MWCILCPLGYYCPPGQNSSMAYPCGTGHHCPEGSPAEVLCPGGEYQDQTTQAECKPCVSGYYCDLADGPISDYTLYPCPNGSYCPNGTSYSTEYLCPAGTYNPMTQLGDISECTQCDPGQFCSGMGNTAPTGM